MGKKSKKKGKHHDKQSSKVKPSSGDDADRTKSDNQQPRDGTSLLSSPTREHADGNKRDPEENVKTSCFQDRGVIDADVCVETSNPCRVQPKRKIKKKKSKSDTTNDPITSEHKLMEYSDNADNLPEHNKTKDADIGKMGQKYHCSTGVTIDKTKKDEFTLKDSTIRLKLVQCLPQS